MNTSSKLFRVAATTLAAGGLCWIVKFVWIAAMDGAASGLPDTVTAVLYFTAVVLIVTGIAGIGVALASGRHVAYRAVGAVAGVVAWVVIYSVVATVVTSLAPQSGPPWLHDELEIVSTGALFMTVGLLLARREPQREQLGAESTHPRVGHARAR